jgi:DNA-binding IclR family transcriptional regulator
VLLRFAHRDTSAGLVELAAPLLRTLAQLSGETINLGVPTPLGVEHLAQEDSRHFVGGTNWVGLSVPLHCAALGKVLLAHHPYVATALTKQGLETFTDATICDGERLERELARIRERGWASDIGELSLAQVSLAAPIMDRSGLTVGAMGIFGPPERLLTARQPRGELLAYVREAARAVSRELGAIPW